MRSILPLLLVVVFSGAPDASAAASEVATKAKAVVQAGAKAVQSGQLPAGAAELKAKAAASMPALKAGAANALQGAQGATSFTPEQLGKVQAQAQQAFSAMTSDPRAAAAAAQAGVTTQKLNAIQAQTATAVAGFKDKDGKPSVEAAGQQAREFMKSEKAQELKGQAADAYGKVKADPAFNEASAKFKKEASSLLNETAAQNGLKVPEKLPTLTPQEKAALRERGVQAVESGELAAAGAGFQTNAEKALIKFCKKYEGKSAAPMRCRKPAPKAPAVTE